MGRRDVQRRGVRRPRRFCSETLVTPFKPVHSLVFDDGMAYVVWRLGTGNNAELLHIQASERFKGYQLLRAMLNEMRPPYATVFGFTRFSNVVARAFYKRHGFTLSKVRGVYDDGAA